MLDIRQIREDPQSVIDLLSLREKDFGDEVRRVAALDAARRQILSQTESLKAEQNAASKRIPALKKSGADTSALMARMKEISTQAGALEETLRETELSLQAALLGLPNLPRADTPRGADSEQNAEVRRFGAPPVFPFAPRSHWEIGEALGLLDPATAAKVTGARFHFYRGAGARLERAIVNFFLDTHTTRGYTEIFPPFLVNRSSMTGTGQLPKFEEDAFKVQGVDYFLIPTAEVPVTNMHRDEILPESRLPLSYCAYSACFRAEAGSAGRDTRGLIRQHQFNKVELVKFTRPEDSAEALEALTADAEEVLRRLGLPHRVVRLCGGDLSAASAITYDIEVWMPSYGRYVEISSCSNFESYQARRAGIRFRREGGKPEFVHTLNGSGVAVGRTSAAILELCQREDGGVTIPEALRPYMGGLARLEAPAR
jgi:seryl-tRNA synthetase